MQRGRSRGDGGRDRSGAAGPGEHQGPGPPRGWTRREEPPRPPDGWGLPTAGPRPLTSGPRFLLLYAPQSAVAVRGLYRGCQPWLQGPALGERERSGRGRNSRCSSLLPCPTGRASFPSARGRRASKVRPIRSRSPATPHAGQRLCPRGADPASFCSPQTHPPPVPPADAPVHAAPPAPRRHAHPHRGWPRSFSRPFRGAMRPRGEHAQLEARSGGVSQELGSLRNVGDPVWLLL